MLYASNFLLPSRIQEDTAEYVAALKASHQREVEKILSQYTKEHSASKVAELNGRISTQEVRHSRYINYTKISVKIVCFQIAVTFI